MSSEAAPNEGSLQHATRLLAQCVEFDARRKALKRELEELESELSKIKESVKDIFIEMGVTSMKALNKTVYIHRDIRAGILPETDRGALADALTASDMADYITCNASKLSAYVKEVARAHPECLDAEGNIVADPEVIVKFLPEPFNTMFRVSDTLDIRIRK